MAAQNQDNHFKFIFWFIVFLTAFGMGFTVYLLVRFKGDVAERFADQMLIFWLSTAVSGGIGYLIGNSMTKTAPVNISSPGTTTADITATITSDTTKKEEKTEDK